LLLKRGLKLPESAAEFLRNVNAQKTAGTAATTGSNMLFFTGARRIFAKTGMI
jgi:hypothetical protein